jgi:hypothetical protein
MAAKSLKRSSITSFEKYDSLLVGNDPYSPNALDLLETVTLTSSQSSVTFSNLSQYASAYKHLKVVVVARTSRECCNNDTVGIRLNGDSGTNYSSHWIMKESSSIFGTGNSVAGNHVFTGYSAAGGTAGAGEFGSYETVILDAFSPSKSKTLKTEFGFMSSGSATVSGISSGAWHSLSPVSSISFHPIHGPGTWQIVQGSRLSLYGIKGA